MDKKRAAAVAGAMFYLQQEADEREESARRGMRRSRSDWSTYGRKAVARGRHMVQARRIRRSVTGALSRRQNSKLWIK